MNTQRYKILYLLASILVLVIFIIFFIDRATTLQNLCKENKIEFNLFIFISKHELLILFLGVLSLVFLWKGKSKIGFLVASFFLSTQIFSLIFAFHLGYVYWIKFSIVILLLWLLLFKNIYGVYENVGYHRISIILFFGGVYVLWLYFLDII